MIQRRIPQKWRPWVMTLTAALFFTYDFIQLNVFNSIGHDLSREFSLSSTELGSLAGVYLTAQTLAMFACGYILDSVVTRTVILSGMGLCVLATFGSAFAPTINMIMLARALAGVTGAFCFLSSLLIASTWFAPSRMSTVVGMVVTMGMLGGVIAQSPMDYWVSLHGWRHAMLCNGIVGSVLWLWMFIILRSGPYRLSTPGYHRFWQGLIAVVKQKQNWLAGLYTALMNLILFVFGAVWGSHYLMITHHVDSANAAWIVTQLFFGTIVGAPFWGYLVDKTRERRRTMLLGSYVSFCLLVLVFCASEMPVWELVSVFFLLGVSTSTQVLSYPHIAACNAPNHLGMAESFAALFILGLGAIGQPMMGWLMDLERVARHETALHYISSDFKAVVWIFPCIMVLAALCAHGIKVPKHRSGHV